MSVSQEKKINLNQNIALSDSLPSKILTNFPEGVWSFDVIAKQVLYYNCTAEKIYGSQLELFYLKEDLGWEIIHPEDRDLVKNSLSEMLETDIVDIEYRIIQRSGKINRVREKKWLVKDENGNPIRLDGTIAQVPQKENLPQTILGNPKIEENGEKVQRKSSQVEKECDRSCDGCEYKILKLKSCQQESLEQKESNNNSLNSTDISSVPFSPPIIWMRLIAYLLEKEAWYREAIAFCNAGVNGKKIDVKDSDRYLSEKTALRLRENLQLAQKITRVGSWEFDVIAQTFRVSEELLHTFGLEEAKSNPTFKQLLEQVHPEDRDLWQQSVEKALTEGKSYQIDRRIVRPDGEIRYINVRGEVFCNEAGYVMRLFETTIDISDRKQAEIELRELVKREALQNRLTNLIRNSLDLDKILETTVWEVRDLLEIDRCYFLWYKQEFPMNEWEVVKEAKIAALPSVVELYPGDALRPISDRVLQTEMLRVDCVDTCEEVELLRFFMALEYMSVLILRVQTASGKIGALVLAHCSESRGWKDSEVELLQAVTNQLAIAIEQAEIYAQSRESARIATTKSLELEETVSKLQKAQAQLVQSEKMSSLGQLVAGVAHEINNPVSFIYGNLFPAKDYIDDILGLVELYQQHYPEPEPEIEEEIERIELDFLVEDLSRLFNSMKIGADRIRDIVKSLRIFSRLDESDFKEVDIHENIDSTLMILNSRLKDQPQPGRPAIEVVKQYGQLPKIECYPGQLNQVFLHLITNAIDALEERDKQRSFEEILAEPSTCWINTQLVDNKAVQIRIADNGIGISSEAVAKIFDPFYTTKAVGSGTGLGLSISYQIVVEKHGGTLRCVSEKEVGTEFAIEIPWQSGNYEQETKTN